MQDGIEVAGPLPIFAVEENEPVPKRVVTDNVVVGRGLVSRTSAKGGLSVNGRCRFFEIAIVAGLSGTSVGRDFWEEPANLARWPRDSEEESSSARREHRGGREEETVAMAMDVDLDVKADGGVGGGGGGDGGGGGGAVA